MQTLYANYDPQSSLPMAARAFCDACRAPQVSVRASVSECVIDGATQTIVAAVGDDHLNC